MNNDNTIFEFITSQESAYKKPIPINKVWNWCMPEHILTTDLYLNSQSHNKTDWTPITNITRPILNLQHRTEDVELKDVQIYVDDSDKYHLSFLVKKYHDDVFVVENSLDTFFDELNVSRIDYGGGLSKQKKGFREVVPLQSIAFCDQTDMLSGPIGLKHFFSPDQLLDMADKGWGDTSKGATISLESLIELSREEKKNDNNVTSMPGRYIEIYEVHGNLPKKFTDNDDTSGKYETRMFICAFYQKKDSMEQTGVILYTAPEIKSPFKLIKRDPVYGRALGFGGGEELFEDQVWTNYDDIRSQDMLDAAAKTIMITQDATLVAKHPTGMKGLENMEFLEEAPNANTRQLDTFPRNIRLFEESKLRRVEHAKWIGASEDPLTGKEPASGTPFASLQAQIQQGMGLHDYRRGQFAKHIEELYTCEDGFLESMVKEICNGRKWLSTLSVKELNFVSERIVENESRKMIIDTVLRGETITPEMVQAHKDMVMQEFKKKGEKHFIEVLKGEFKNVKLSVKVSVAGKSKNLGASVDKINNLVRFVISTFNPQTNSFTALDDPRIAGLVNEALELSGMSQIDMTQKIPQLAQLSPMQPAQMQTQQPEMA